MAPVQPVNGAPAAGSAALFVGVNTFSDRSLNPLRFAVDDAVAQARLFVLDLKLVPPANCHLCLAGDPAGAAIKAQLAELETAGARRMAAGRTDVLDAMDAVLGSAAKPDDLLVVSLSTHGYEEGDVRFVMPADGRTGRLGDTGIPLATIRRDLSRSAAGKRLLLVDACRNQPLAGGAAVAARGDAGRMSEGFRKALGEARGQAVLQSCAAGEYSYEHEAFGHGVFTHYLLAALGAGGGAGDAAAIAAPDPRGFLIVRAVYERASEGAAKWAKEQGTPTGQTLTFDGDIRAEAIRLAVDPGIRAGWEAFRADRDKVSDALKAKIDRNGPFTTALWERLADSLNKADRAREADQVLLDVARDFADGRMRAAPFIAYLEKVLPEALDGKSFTNTLGMKFVRIEPGEFLMGGPENVPERGSDERQHRVKITRLYRSGRTRSPAASSRRSSKTPATGRARRRTGRRTSGPARTSRRRLGRRSGTSGSSRRMNTRSYSSVGTTPRHSVAGWRRRRSGGIGCRRRPGGSTPRVPGPRRPTPGANTRTMAKGGPTPPTIRRRSSSRLGRRRSAGTTGMPSRPRSAGSGQTPGACTT